MCVQHKTYRSWLSCDAGNAVHLAYRSNPIAGKPGSHNPCATFPCGSGLARDAGNAVHLAHRSDPIAGKPGSHNPGSHTVVAPPAPGPIDSPRWPHSLVTAVGQMHRVACIASKPAPTGECGAGVVGVGLARDVVTAVGQMHRTACIAGKPAPTGECGAGGVGAGLARDGVTAVGQDRKSVV